MNKELRHFNPFHDKLGRFSSARGGGAASAASTSSTTSGKYRVPFNDKDIDDMVADVMKMKSENDSSYIWWPYDDWKPRDDRHFILCGKATENNYDPETFKKDLKKIQNSIGTLTKNSKTILAKALVNEEFQYINWINKDYVEKHNIADDKEKQIRLVKKCLDDGVSGKGGQWVYYDFNERTVTIALTTNGDKGKILQAQGDALAPIIDLKTGEVKDIEWI